MMQLFFKSMTKDKLPDKSQYGLSPIYCDFLKSAFDIT
jgi:hypothetical protein